MANLEFLRNVVKRRLLDPSVTADSIDAALNECLSYVSGRLLIAKLETTGVVNTVLNECEVAIPEGWNYDRNLFGCSVADAAPIQILNSVSQLVNLYPNFRTEKKSGPIEYILVNKGNLIYYPIPKEVVELTTEFYMSAPLMTKDTDIPSIIPIGLQKKLLTSFALKELYLDVEDGVEGATPNTAKYNGLFEIAFDELDDTIETGQSRPEPHRVTGWF